MSRVHGFVVDLARAGETAQTILNLCKVAHGDKVLSLSQVYRIIADVKAGMDPWDKRNQNVKRIKHTDNLVKAMKAFVEDDRRVTFKDIAKEFQVSDGTIRNMILELSRRLHDGFQKCWQKHTKWKKWDVLRHSWRPTAAWGGPF